MQLWTVRMRGLRNMVSMVDQQKLKTWLYLEKKGVLALIACLALV